MSLLPARYHVFARALEGAFVCLNANHPAHAEQGKPRFFLTRHEQCPHCRSWVFEVATCPRCGTVYIVGREADEYAAGGRAQRVLRQASASNDATMDSLSYFILAEQVQKPDEDEAVMIGESVDRLENERLEPLRGMPGLRRRRHRGRWRATVQLRRHAVQDSCSGSIWTSRRESPPRGGRPAAG